jgi:LysR family glycine cleavage system transcriptional activator
MRNLRFKLPPLNSLVIFEAAARHLSFTRAGEELLISREAVSRQIRSLESFIDQQLFIRLHRALELTEAGIKLQATVSDSLEAIANTTSELIDPKAGSSVVVSATVAIASLWLTARLPRFRSTHPGTTIHVTVMDSPGNMRHAGINIGLRYGDGAWPGLCSIRLFDVESIPVCSPGYLTNAPALSGSVDLCRHTLLNLDGPSHAPEDWAWWLSAFRAPSPEPSQVIGFDNYANVIQAALNGQGIALGFSGLVDELIDRGQLIAPLTERRGRDLGVYLVTPDDTPMSTSTRQFHDWLLDETRQTGD